MNDIYTILLTTIVGLGSSLITLIVTKIIEAYQEKKQFKRNLFKLIFERKTIVVEQAMGWYQEALDNYRMLQMGCNAYQNGTEDYALSRLYLACQQSDKLFKEAPSRLNPIYLYYDFSKIEQKYQSCESLEIMNGSINKIAVLVFKMQSSGANSKTSPHSSQELKELLLSLSDCFDNQIRIIQEIQNILRNDYKI
ncbi:MAG: hypothetical protein ACLTSL_13365 [Odoribacter splanchnicus]